MRNFYNILLQLHKYLMIKNKMAFTTRTAPAQWTKVHSNGLDLFKKSFGKRKKYLSNLHNTLRTYVTTRFFTVRYFHYQPSQIFWSNNNRPLRLK